MYRSTEWCQKAAPLEIRFRRSASFTVENCFICYTVPRLLPRTPFRSHDFLKSSTISTGMTIYKSLLNEGWIFRLQNNRAKTQEYQRLQKTDRHPYLSKYWLQKLILRFKSSAVFSCSFGSRSCSMVHHPSYPISCNVLKMAG